MRAARLLGVAWAAGILCLSSEGQDVEPPATSRATFDRVVRPFLAAHCVKCHGEAKHKGDIRLDQIGGNLSAGEAASLWRKVLEQVQGGDMPPEKETRPDPKAVQAVVAWIEAGLRDAEKSAAARGGGPASVRRLNSREYTNTIRDLFGVDLQPARSFPAENRVQGFDNIASGLTVTPLLLEKYVEAAGEITRRVIHTERPQTIKKHVDGVQMVNRNCPVEGTAATILQSHPGGQTNSPPFQIGREGKGQFKTPVPGQYVLRARVAAAGGGGCSPALPHYTVYKPEHLAGVPAGDEPPRLALFAKGEPLTKIEAGRTVQTHEFRFYAEAGTSFSFIFENGARQVNWGKVPEIKAEYLKRGPGLTIHWIEVEGPLFDQWPPASHQKIFFRGPSAEKTRPYAKEILERFATRAYRRPAAPEEVATLLSIFDRQTQEGKAFEDAVASGIQLALCSPNFLCLTPQSQAPSGLRHAEAAAATAAQAGKRPLGAYELASRLSYFLWSTMPDEALLACAADGSLPADPRVLETQVRRMLKDPKAKALTDGFYRQWAQLSKLGEVAVDPRLYPEFDDPLRTLFQRESDAFFEEILKRDLSLLNFIDSDFAMLNDRLARHYGVEGVKGSELRPVILKEGSHRGGLATQGAILTMTTCGTRTSPVMRGVWVLETLLGTPPPQPPQEVPGLAPDLRGVQTLRERIAKHREDPACARCHVKIDPLGLALENYDVIGLWRTQMGSVSRKPGEDPKKPAGAAIDASGQLPGGQKFDGPDGFKRALLQRKDDFLRGFTEKLLTYALGRGLDLGDRPTVQSLVLGLQRGEPTLSKLVVEIAKSEPFRNW